MTLDGVIASRGGIPLVQAGKLIGAIGCSGGTGSQDEVACRSVLRPSSSPGDPPPVAAAPHCISNPSPDPELDLGLLAWVS